MRGSVTFVILLVLKLQNACGMFIGKGCFLCDTSKIEIDFSEFNPTGGDGEPVDEGEEPPPPPPPPTSDCRAVRDAQLSSSDGPDSVFIPICDTNGYYLTLQCFKPSKTCWCVDKRTGEKIADSVTPMEKGPPKCAKWPVEAVTATSSTKATTHTIRTGLCRETRAKIEQKYHEKQVKDAWLVECDEEGNFVPLQCNVNTKRCVCLHKISGRELEGTEGTTDNKPDCSGSGKFQAPPPPPPPTSETGCKAESERLLKEIKEKGLSDAWVKQCDAEGNYVQLQCIAMTPRCVCLDKHTGEEIPGKDGTIDNKPDCGAETTTKLPAKRGNYRQSRNN